MGRVELDGFVISAEGPDAGWTTGRQQLELMVRLPGGETLVLVSPKVEIERWIVPGMVVPLSIDPAEPRRCDVLTDRIPPLSQRLADDDWTLCDLEEVGVLVKLAMFEVGLATFDGGRAELEKRLREDKQRRLAARPDGEQVEPDGRLRGTADLVAYESRPSSHTNNTNSVRPLGWDGQRIYRVWPFGRDPYAVRDEVHLPGSSSDRDRALLAEGGVPITVNPDRHDDVEFLWAEWEAHRARREASRRVVSVSHGGKVVVSRRMLD